MSAGDLLGTAQSALNTPTILYTSNKPIWPTTDEKEYTMDEHLGNEPIDSSFVSLMSAASPPLFDMEHISNLSELNVLEIRNILGDPDTPNVAPTSTPPKFASPVKIVSMEHEMLTLEPLVDMAPAMDRQISIPGLDQVVRNTQQDSIYDPIRFETPSLNETPDFLDTDVDLAEFLAPFPAPEVTPKEEDDSMEDYNNRELNLETLHVDAQMNFEEMEEAYESSAPSPTQNRAKTGRPYSRGRSTPRSTTDSMITVIGGKLVVKDDKYWANRNKNNQASRASRLTRKQKQEMMEGEVVDLERHNARLRANVHKLEAMTVEWKQKLLDIMANKE